MGQRSFAVIVRLAAVLALSGAGQSARAGTALALEPELQGAAVVAEKAALRAAISEALRSQQYSLVAATELDSMLSGEPQLKGCYSALCLERLGRLLDSQVVVRYKVQSSAGPGKGQEVWHLSVDLYDTDVGALGASVTQDCAACTGKSGAAQLGDLVKRALQQSTARPRGTLAITSEPAGAAVFVDGTELGITPYQRRAFVGPHKVVLRHVGFRSEQIDVTVDAQQQPAIERRLVAGSDPALVSGAGSDKTPVYKKWWFWVILGGTAVAVGAAVTTGIVLGTKSDRNVPANTLQFMF